MFHLPNYSQVFGTNHISTRIIEEIYYIINGTGRIKIGNEETQFRDGDIIYIPPNTVHSIKNDSGGMIDFLAFGGYTGRASE